jgi:hypothetical protein
MMRSHGSSDVRKSLSTAIPGYLAVESAILTALGTYGAAACGLAPLEGPASGLGQAERDAGSLKGGRSVTEDHPS